MKKRPMSRKAYSSLGGLARKAKLSPKRRQQIAKKAAEARWNPPHTPCAVRRAAIASSNE